MGLTQLASESWKPCRCHNMSVRGQNVSQTSALSLRGSKEVNIGLTQLAPESWESVSGKNVCRPECVMYHCFG